MRRPKLTLVAALVAISLVGAVGAGAHVNHQVGGPNGDLLDGHGHTDKQEGKGGCDELLGRGEWDEGFGGESGCDIVRGMEGSGDAAIICDDNAGNDQAYGGGGPYDWCFASGLDFVDFSTCELVRFEGYNCA